MARLYHAGFEIGADHAEGLTATGTGTATYDTTTFRSGLRSLKLSSDAGNLAIRKNRTGTAVTDIALFWQMAIYFPSATGMPTTATTDLLRVADSGLSVRFKLAITSAGKLRFYDGSSVQMGSDSTATLTTNTWYVLSTKMLVSATPNADAFELVINGATDITATGQETGGTNIGGEYRFGFVSVPGASIVMYMDDIAINDASGSNNTTHPAQDKVVILTMISDNADGGWTAGGGGTSLFAGVSNIPPVGAASPGTNTSQIGNAVSSTTDNADLNAASYTTAGIGSADTITAVYGVVEGANDSTTGADTLRVSVVSNPAVTEATPSIDVLAAAYPSGWGRGATTILGNPTVTKGTSPVMRVGKNIASTRRANVCFMGMYVSYTPAVAAQPVYELNPRQLAHYRM